MTGFDDNASGTAAVLELARALATARCRPKFPLRPSRWISSATSGKCSNQSAGITCAKVVTSTNTPCLNKL